MEEVLAQAFIELLDLCFSTVRHDESYPSGPPSYNILLTLEHMYLFPRREESHVLSETGEQLSINALGFAGMILVKSPEELEAVTKEGVGNVLKAVACASVHEQQVDDTIQIDKTESGL